MSSPQIPPRTEPMVDNQKNVTLPWQAFFESTSAGDPGNNWTPTFQSLSFTGPAPDLKGVFYFLSQKLVYFHIIIVPGTGGDTSGVAGTTYCDNFPLNISVDGGSFTIGGSSAAVAAITAGTKRVYTGTWTNAVVPITIVGIAELI